jgi:RNA polymerase sigma-70 factor (ECF subfamily)
MRDDDQLGLVLRIQRGDTAAESELFHRYQNPILWKICRQIKTDRENINDLASEVYLAILEGLRKETFRPEKWDSLEAFIWGVANNKIRHWFKNERCDRKTFDRVSPSEEIAVATEEFLLEAQELRQFLKNCLNALDAKFKEVLDLRYFQELSVAEISAQLGIPAPRVSERIHYALKKLRQICAKKGNRSSILGLLVLLLS